MCPDGSRGTSDFEAVKQMKLYHRTMLSFRFVGQQEESFRAMTTMLGEQSSLRLGTPRESIDTSIDESQSIGYGQYDDLCCYQLDVSARVLLSAWLVGPR